MLACLCVMTGYEARLTVEQPAKKEMLFELVCPGRKSYLVSDSVALVDTAALHQSMSESPLICSSLNVYYILRES